jgi:hypothetical protein
MASQSEYDARGRRSWHHRCASVLANAAPRVKRESGAARRHKAGDELARGGHGRVAAMGARLCSRAT